MRIQVDDDRCEGHGMCEETAPELFVLDEEGRVHVSDQPVPNAAHRAAEAGVRACPVAALTLLDA